MDENERLFKKFFPEDISLETPRVILRLMNASDYDAFLPISRATETWKYFTKNLHDEKELRAWIDEAIQGYHEQKRVPFTVIDKDARSIAGSTSYGNISFYDDRIEIGWTWVGTEFAGTGVNKHAKFALLSYAFEVMKMKRVEIKTDVLNERAKAALLKVGMIPEGVLRSHMLMHSDRRRDTMYFSILANEWPERKQSFFPELI